MREDRLRCLRCAQTLGQPPRSRPPTSRFRVRAAWAGAALLVVGVTLFGTLTTVRRADVPRPATVATTTSAPESARTPDAAPAERAQAAWADLDPALAGRVAYDRGELSDAVAEFQRAVDANPHDPEAVNGLGQVLVRSGKPDAALPFFQRAIELNPTRWAYRFNLARCYGQLQQWDTAVTEYRAALRLFPDDYLTQYNLAMALDRSGDGDLAIVELQRAIDLRPGEPSFYLALGIVHERLGHSADAVRGYTRYLELSPDASDAGMVRDHVSALSSAAVGSAVMAVRPGDTRQ